MYVLDYNSRLSFALIYFNPEEIIAGEMAICNFFFGGNFSVAKVYR